MSSWLRWRQGGREWFYAGAAAGAALGIAACLAASPLRGLVSDGPELEPGELVIMMDSDQSSGQQRLRLIEEWAAAYGYQVTVRQVPPTATAAHSQLVAHAQSGAGGVDIYSLDVTWIAEFAEEGWIRRLRRSTVDEDSFLAQPLAAGEYGGQLYALPFNTDAGLLFYRTDLVPGGPPETWADLLALAEQAWARDDLPTTPEAAYAGQFADYEGFTVNVLEAILAEDPAALAGGESFEVTTATTGAVERLVEGLRADGDGRPLILPESLGYREEETRTAFQDGRVMFMRNWPVAYRLLTEAGVGDPPALTPEQVGVARLPSVAGGAGPGVLGGQSLAVADGTDQPRAAQALIEYLTSARSQEILFDEGGFAPTQKIVYHNQRYQDHPYLSILRVAVEEASPRPIHRRYDGFSEALRRVVRPYLVVAADPSQEPLSLGPLAGRLAGELADAFAGRRG